MSALQPRSRTPGNGNLWSYFDVEMIEKLTLLFPLFIIYTPENRVGSLACERLPHNSSKSRRTRWCE